MKSYCDMMTIDPTDLDGEWLSQAGRYQEMAELSAQAEVEEDMAKDRLDVVKAELDISIRSNPEAQGLGVKPTEGAINAMITSHPLRKEAFEKLMDCRRSALAVKGTLTSLDHRKKALEKLVEREMAGLRASPRPPGQDMKPSEVRTRVSGKVSDQIGDRMNRNRKPATDEFAP